MVLTKKLQAIFLFTMLLCSISCMTQYQRTYKVFENIMIEMKIDFQETINSSQKGIPIYIELINLSNDFYKVSSMKYWSNVLIQLRKENQVLQGIKVKPNFSKRRKYIELSVGESKKEEFTFQFDQIYQNLQKGEYTLEVKYIGDIINKDGKLIKGISEIKALKKFTIE